MNQQSLEERVAYLERKLAEYETERAQMRELAALRTDIQELHANQNEMHDDLRLRIHAAGAETREEIDSKAEALRIEYHAGYTYLRERIGDVEQSLENLQTGQQNLAVGQQQILEILLGKTKTND